LKLGMRHMEAEDEIQGTLFWNGNPTTIGAWTIALRLRVD